MEATEIKNQKIHNKLKAMEDRYLKNLKFFEERIPALHRQITDNPELPSISIDPNTLNVNRLEEGKGVYQIDSIEHALTEVNNFYKTFDKKIYTPNPRNIDITHLIKKKAFRTTATLYAQELIRIGPQNCKPANIDLVVFGIGLGYHVEMLCNSNKFTNITVIENDVRNLKASMYTINWYTLLTNMRRENSITFHVQNQDQDKDSFVFTLKHHCHRLFPSISISTLTYNHVPDYVHYRDAKEVFEEYATHMKVSTEVIGPEAQRLFNANYNISKGFPAIDLSKSTIEEGKLISIIGGGPSLDIYAPLLKEYRDKFFIVTAGSGLSSLLKLDLKPDIHFELEFQVLATELLNHVNKDNVLNDLNLVSTFEANPGFPGMFNSAYMFIPESSELRPILGEAHTLKRGGITCTNGATAFCSTISSNDIFLFGLDFAYTNGLHHAKSNVSQEDELPEELSRIKTVPENRPANLPVDGTLGEKVMTCKTLNSARITMESLLTETANNIFNCSHGAAVNGSEYISYEDLEKRLKESPSNKNSYNFESREVNQEVIFQRTKSLLESSLKEAFHILELVKQFKTCARENAYNIKFIFDQIHKKYQGDMGQMRNVLSCIKQPLLQLYVVTNFLPDQSQKKVIDSWVKDFDEYLKNLKNIFETAIETQDFLVEEDWVDEERA